MQGVPPACPLPITPPGTPTDGRFAPSPSGELHLGNLRTALAAWLHARSGGGRFLVRIDDLDPDRSRVDIATLQLRTLGKLGLGPDEPPVQQSARAPLYRWALDELVQAGRAYGCFCTRADVREAATAPHGAEPSGRCPNACAGISSAERARRIAAGERASLRVHGDGVHAYDDLVLGHVRSTVDDFVVQRKDGVAAYNLACAVDDGVQGIGTVLRGSDLAPSTVRQRWLAEVLDLPVPRHAHIGLVVGDDGTRLAKRHGAVTLTQLERRDVHARNVLGLLGHSLGLCEAGDQPTLAALQDRYTPGSLSPTHVRIAELPPAAGIPQHLDQRDRSVKT